ncbi:MAG: ABC transporter ATP-binding protein, partial [Candidatus Aenigmatarchaeota archaeon]
ANNPKIILADEPTGNLDTKRGEEIINLLENLNKEGKTLIIVTHDLSIAKRAERKIMIRDGMVIKE